MIWNNLKKFIERKFSKPDKKEWLDKLVENIETKKIENAILPFKIIDLKNKGFLVKVSGLYAFISFNHMPWKYSKNDYWTSIFPKLIGKVFFCRIQSVKKEPLLSIVINGESHKFKKRELLIGENYRGVIIEKVRSGIFIDVGYHFDWRCGSYIGYLHKSQFDTVQLFSNSSVGDEIKILYQGVNEKGLILYSRTNEILDWNNAIPQGLLGQIVLVHIVRGEDDKVPKLLVKGKYNGKMIYELGSKKTTRKIKNNLKDGEIIHCEVIGFKEKERVLKLKWAAELNNELIEDVKKNIGSKRIINNLSDDTIQKLIAIRDEIE